MLYLHGFGFIFIRYEVAYVNSCALESTIPGISIARLYFKVNSKLLVLKGGILILIIWSRTAKTYSL